MAKKKQWKVGKPRKSYMNGEMMFRIDGPEVVSDYEDWGYTKESARRIVACVNACKDEDTDMLEAIVRNGTTVRKRHDEALGQKEQYQRELCEMERQRDELLEAAKLGLHAAEGWVKDQLEGTSMFAAAMQELDPIRAAIAKAEAANG